MSKSKALKAIHDEIIAAFRPLINKIEEAGALSGGLGRGTESAEALARHLHKRVQGIGLFARDFADEIQKRGGIEGVIRSLPLEVADELLKDLPSSFSPRKQGVGSSASKAQIKARGSRKLAGGILHTDLPSPKYVKNVLREYGGEQAVKNFEALSKADQRKVVEQIIKFPDVADLRLVEEAANLPPAGYRKDPAFEGLYQKMAAENRLAATPPPTPLKVRKGIDLEKMTRTEDGITEPIHVNQLTADEKAVYDEMQKASARSLEDVPAPYFKRSKFGSSRGVEVIEGSPELRRTVQSNSQAATRAFEEAEAQLDDLARSQGITKEDLGDVIFGVDYRNENLNQLVGSKEASRIRGLTGRVQLAPIRKNITEIARSFLRKVEGLGAEGEAAAKEFVARHPDVYSSLVAQDIRHANKNYEILSSEAYSIGNKPWEKQRNKGLVSKVRRAQAALDEALGIPSADADIPLFTKRLRDRRIAARNARTAALGKMPKRKPMLENTGEGLILRQLQKMKNAEDRAASLDPKLNLQSRSVSSAMEPASVVSDKANYDVRAMRSKGKTMANTGPEDYGKRDSGWLGNPYAWAGNGGPANRSREQAVAMFKKDFMQKIESDSAFKEAVHNLQGKRLGYYKPNEVEGSHVGVILNYLKSIDSVPATRTGKSQEMTIGQTLDEWLEDVLATRPEILSQVPNARTRAQVLREAAGAGPINKPVYHGSRGKQKFINPNKGEYQLPIASEVSKVLADSSRKYPIEKVRQAINMRLTPQEQLLIDYIEQNPNQVNPIRLSLLNRISGMAAGENPQADAIERVLAKLDMFDETGGTFRGSTAPKRVYSPNDPEGMFESFQPPSPLPKTNDPDFFSVQTGGPQINRLEDPENAKRLVESDVATYVNAKLEGLLSRKPGSFAQMEMSPERFDKLVGDFESATRGPGPAQILREAAGAAPSQTLPNRNLPWVKEDPTLASYISKYELPIYNAENYSSPVKGRDTYPEILNQILAENLPSQMQKAGIYDKYASDPIFRSLFGLEPDPLKLKEDFWGYVPKMTPDWNYSPVNPMSLQTVAGQAVPMPLQYSEIWNRLKAAGMVYDPEIRPMIKTKPIPQHLLGSMINL